MYVSQSGLMCPSLVPSKSSPTSWNVMAQGFKSKAADVRSASVPDAVHEACTLGVKEKDFKAVAPVVLSRKKS